MSVLVHVSDMNFWSFKQWSSFKIRFLATKLKPKFDDINGLCHRLFSFSFTKRQAVKAYWENGSTAPLILSPRH